jgi:signal transduction histidine kinase/CheY-like chemotaxis protein
MSTSPELDRLRGLARVLASLGEPPSVQHLGNRVCQLARRHLEVDAAVLFVDDAANDTLQRVGAAGSDVPQELMRSLASADIDRLREWASSASFMRVELAPLALDGHPVGLLALFSTAGAPLDAADLETLGAGVSQALAHVRSAYELTRAFAKQDREQDQLLRAERMRALGDMALGIAHDFNNALNAILGQTGVLYQLVDKAEALAALDKMRKVALDGAATIGRVQEFSGQRRDREFSDVDMSALLDDVSTELRLRAPDNVELSIAVGSGRNVRGNVDELRELLRAILDNALEAMPAGGRLTLDETQLGDDLALVVSDTGVGMTPAVRRRAFDPFFTTKGSRTKGLGLSVAYGIARRHGGIIELDSTSGQGTRVRVRLPSVPVMSEAPSPTAARPRFQDEALRVLLVEDDPDNRDAMAALLGLSGFVVTQADSGGAGVRAFALGHFDIVLTDLGLPDMDGWQVAGEIKQLAPSLPVALITGWGLNLDEDEIRRRGVDLLIKKPLDPRAFLRQLENLVQAGARKPSA